MAKLVGIIAMSHSPSWDLSPKLDGPGGRFVAAVQDAKHALEQARPDALVVFGPDHFRNFFYDVLPPFCIGVEAVESYGDYATASGPLPAAQRLGRDILEHVMEHGFDPATSLHMSIDHGITQPYQALDPALHIPMVPVMVNGSGAPRPSFRRCFDFGRAVGDAIRASSAAERVVVVGSGGMSHFLPPVSADDAGIAPETRDYIINGRARSREYNAVRERSSAERKKAGTQGRVSEAWDRWFLDCLETGALDGIFAMPPAEMEQQAGNGAHELRAWMAALGAWNGPVKVAGYEPVPLWVTGMGCVTGFTA